MENAIQSFHSIVQGSAWHSATGLVQYSLPGHQVTTISSFEKLFLKFYFQYNKQNVVMVKKQKQIWAWYTRWRDSQISRFTYPPAKKSVERIEKVAKKKTDTFMGLCFCLGGMTLCIECSGVTGTGLGEYICKLSTCSALVHSFYWVRVTGFPTQPKTATWSPASKAWSPSKTSSGTSGGQRSCGVWCPRLRWSGRADTQVQKDTTYKLTTRHHLPRVEDSWTSSMPTAPQTSTTNSMPSHCSNKQCRWRRPSFATTCRRRVFWFGGSRWPLVLG